MGIPIKKNKSKLTKFGSICFDIGIFLLPSAFLIAGFLLLFSSIIGFINQKGFLNDKWNKFLFVGSILIIFSSLINYVRVFESELYKLPFTNKGEKFGSGKSGITWNPSIDTDTTPDEIIIE